MKVDIVLCSYHLWVSRSIFLLPVLLENCAKSAKITENHGITSVGDRPLSFDFVEEVDTFCGIVYLYAKAGHFDRLIGGKGYSN